MVTARPERPTIPLTPTVILGRPQETTVRTQPAVVRDADDEPLAFVELAWPPAGDSVMLGEVDDQYWLMTYYFGRGGRDVTLTLDDHAVSVRLETRWEGNHRIWWLDFDD